MPSFGASFMTRRAFYVTARVLSSSVFVGLGFERLLTVAGVLGAGAATAGAGALAFGVFELVAGLMILLGWQLRWMAPLMAAFLVVDAFLSHPFWRYAGTEQHGQLLHFLKNVSITGGLLLLSWVESVREDGPTMGRPG
jgi:putative oxidoreductase